MLDKCVHAYHNGRADMNCLRPPNTGIVGSNSTRGMHVSVCLFCVCIGLGVGSGLAAIGSPVQGVLPTVY